MKLKGALLTPTLKVMLGGFAACLATISGGLAGMLMIGDDSAEMAEKFLILAQEAAEGGKLNALLAAPVIETLFFLLAFKTLNVLQIARQPKKAVLAMALTMGIVGWLLHDARDSVVAQSFGFAVLGGLFATLQYQSGSMVAFVGTALAHMIWNLSIFVLALAVGPSFVWESRIEHAIFNGTRTVLVGDFVTADQCREMGLLHLQRMRAGGVPQQEVQSRIKCERVLRSQW
jgi:hypothetical protein